MSTNKYKGMTDYGVKTQDIEDYAKEVGMEPTDVWKRVIDKFVENGATEDEGYTPSSSTSFRNYWRCWDYVKILNVNKTWHGNVSPETLLTVKDLLEGCDDMVEEGVVTSTHAPEDVISLPITVRIVPQDVIKFLSDNHTMTFSFKRLNETSDKWKGFDGFSGDGVHLVQVYFKED